MNTLSKYELAYSSDSYERGKTKGFEKSEKRDSKQHKSKIPIPSHITGKNKHPCDD